MTRATNARIAGFMFLAYIAAGHRQHGPVPPGRRRGGGRCEVAGIAAHVVDMGILAGSAGTALFGPAVGRDALCDHSG